MQKFVFTSAASVLALVGTGLAVPTVGAQTPAQTCTTEIVSGTLDWGIKQSFRSYIQGPIAKGEWTASGAVTEDSTSKTDAGFQFHFEVDPDKSSVTVDGGKVTAADIQTKDSTLVMEGHKGALYTNMSNPYVEVSGSTAKTGVSYLGYYVEGQGMTEYTPEDRTDGNKKTGKDTFAEGGASTSVEGDTVKISTTGLTYKPKAGTRYESDTQKTFIEGVDIIFMGMYNADYKPEMDDATITLQTKQSCTSNTEPTSSAPATSAASTTVATPAPTANPAPTTKPAPTTQPAPTTKPAVNPTSTTSAQAPSEEGSSFGKLWNTLLAVFALFAMFGTIASAVYSTGVLDRFLKPRG